MAGFLARDNHLHTHPPATHICVACWLCRWKGNASIGTAYLPHNALRGHVPVPNECHGEGCGQCHGKSSGQCWQIPARRCLQIIHQARDNHLHTHPPATHICGACWLCRWRGNASIGTAHLPHNALRGQVPVLNECHGKILGQCHVEIVGQCH